jgi:hypothetical protein
MADRSGEDPVLLPGRDKQRRRACERGIALVVTMNAHCARASGKSQPGPGTIDRQLIDQPEEEEHPGEQ